jgi:hypothetical protein
MPSAASYVPAFPPNAPSLKALQSSAVTAVHAAGMAIETILKVAGHASTQVTIERYQSVNAERARPEFEVIAAHLAARRTDRVTDQHGRIGRSTAGVSSFRMKPTRRRHP